MESPLLIAVLSALAITIAWNVVFTIKKIGEIDDQITDLLLEIKSLKVKDAEQDKSYNTLIIDIHGIRNDLLEKIIINQRDTLVMFNELKSDTKEMKNTLHSLDKSIVKLDSTLNHIRDDFAKQQKEIDSLKNGK